MPDCDLASAEAKAELIRTAIASLSTDGGTPPVRASFNVASRPETTAGGEDLVPHADCGALCREEQRQERRGCLAPKAKHPGIGRRGGPMTLLAERHRGSAIWSRCRSSNMDTACSET